MQWSDHMDLLYNTAWLCAAKRRKAHRGIEPDRLFPAPAPSGVRRLLLAVAAIAVIVALLGHASDRRPALVASTTMPSHLGALK
jgi:hypothetical protein